MKTRQLPHTASHRTGTECSPECRISMCCSAMCAHDSTAATSETRSEPAVTGAPSVLPELTARLRRPLHVCRADAEHLFSALALTISSHCEATAHEESRHEEENDHHPADGGGRPLRWYPRPEPRRVGVQPALNSGGALLARGRAAAGGGRARVVLHTFFLVKQLSTALLGKRMSRVPALSGLLRQREKFTQPP